MPFVTELDPSGGAERRRSGRRETHAVSGLWADQRPFNVIVHDISEHGFRAEFSSDLAVDDVVRLRLAHAGFAPARVAWRRGREHGCEFLSPISEAEADATFAIAPITPEPDEEDIARVAGVHAVEKPAFRHARTIIAIVAAAVLVELGMLVYWML